MFRKFFGKAPPAALFPDIMPDAPVVVVGDVHGRADLLRRLLENVGEYPLVFVGDYIDRGPESAEVLAMLHARPDILCLSGNHEVMMREFLADPAGKGSRWLGHGGRQTLHSFGVPSVTRDADSMALQEARDALAEAMGPKMLGWLDDMPAMWMSGNVAVVHAAADPDRPIDQQNEQTLHWGHPEFMKRPRKDGIWVVHGHTIVANALVQDGRISIDTGAYASGRLTGVLLENGQAHAEAITV